MPPTRDCLSPFALQRRCLCAPRSATVDFLVCVENMDTLRYVCASGEPKALQNYTYSIRIVYYGHIRYVTGYIDDRNGRHEEV